MRLSQAVVSAGKCLGWMLDRMAAGPDAQNGIYECYRVDTKTRTSCVRPDCNAEAARAIWLYAKLSGDAKYSLAGKNILDWLVRAQLQAEGKYRGSYPFYLVDGRSPDDTLSRCLYQNDNGKVLVALIDLYRDTGDERLLRAAEALAEFWMSLQTPEGFFFDAQYGRLQAAHRGPCFVLWLALGLCLCYAETGKELYKERGARAFRYALGLQLPGGRMKTTYEMEKGEAWRPASSETAIALYCFARAYRELQMEGCATAAVSCARHLQSLQDRSGGILNCSAGSLGASEQSSLQLCDLVYTQGYAIMGLSEMAKADRAYLPAAQALAGFLASIQCDGESPLWDGAWRGAYHVGTRRWSGRANQSNRLEEGGMYAIYTGWCCMPIVQGLLEVAYLTECGGRR